MKSDHKINWCVNWRVVLRHPFWCLRAWRAQRSCDDTQELSKPISRFKGYQQLKRFESLTPGQRRYVFQFFIGLLDMEAFGFTVTREHSACAKWAIDELEHALDEQSKSGKTMVEITAPETKQPILKITQHTRVFLRTHTYIELHRGVIVRFNPGEWEIWPGPTFHFRQTR